MKQYEVYCSFCGKEKAKTKKMIAGPDGIFICDECVGLCVEMMSKMPPENVELKYNRNIDEIEYELQSLRNELYGTNRRILRSIDKINLSLRVLREEKSKVTDSDKK